MGKRMHQLDLALVGWWGGAQVVLGSAGVVEGLEEVKACWECVIVVAIFLMCPHASPVRYVT